MTPDVPTVNGEESLTNVFETLQKQKKPVVAVLDEANKLIGYINSENLAELMMIRASQQR